jgi:Ring hydroxylating beta subunit
MISAVNVTKDYRTEGGIHRVLSVISCTIARADHRVADKHGAETQGGQDPKLVYRNRVESETDILVGKREDKLRRVGSDWQIANRKILLNPSMLLSKNLTFFF